MTGYGQAFSKGKACVWPPRKAGNLRFGQRGLVIMKRFLTLGGFLSTAKFAVAEDNHQDKRY